MGSAAAKPVQIKIMAHGKHSFATYGINKVGEYEHDQFHHITKPGEETVMHAELNTSWAVRSTDMKFRTIIIVDNNDDKKTAKIQPWKLCFLNPMHEGKNSNMELKHGKPPYEYVWIENGTMLCHSTDHGHGFELRNKEKEPVIFMLIKDPKDEL